MCPLLSNLLAGASDMRETFSALKGGKLTKFSSRRGISSKVLHLPRLIFPRGPATARNNKKHGAAYGAIVLEHTAFAKRFSLAYCDRIANITRLLSIMARQNRAPPQKSKRASSDLTFSRTFCLRNGSTLARKRSTRSASGDLLRDKIQDRRTWSDSRGIR